MVARQLSAGSLNLSPFDNAGIIELHGFMFELLDNESMWAKSRDEVIADLMRNPHTPGARLRCYYSWLSSYVNVTNSWTAQLVILYERFFF